MELLRVWAAALAVALVALAVDGSLRWLTGWPSGSWFSGAFTGGAFAVIFRKEIAPFMDASVQKGQGE